METAQEEDIFEAAVENTAGNSDRLVRTTGSRLNPTLDTGEDVLEMIKISDWTEITSEVKADGASFGNCVYYKAQIPVGFTGAMSVSSIDGMFRAATGMSIDEWEKLDDDESERRAELAAIGAQILNSVQPSWGAHGPELVTDVQSVPTDFIVMGIGPATGPFDTLTVENAAIYMWHPGMPTAPAKISTATIKLG
jgi:hypothetical protein